MNTRTSQFVDQSKSPKIASEQPVKAPDFSRKEPQVKSVPEPANEIISMPRKELAAKIASMEEALTTEQYQLVQALACSLDSTLTELQKARMTIQKMQAMTFGKKAEKVATIFPEMDKKKAVQEAKPEVGKEERKKGGKPKGKGRNKAKDHVGAKEVFVPCEVVQAHQRCPSCAAGKIYIFKPGVTMRFSGQAPIEAVRYVLGKYRCQLCSKIFSAELPVEAGEKRYDESVAATVATLKYDASMPFHRQEKLLANYGIYLSDSNLWMLVNDGKTALIPILEEIRKHLARSSIMYVDDTTNRVLDLTVDDGDGRKGIWTTGLIGIMDDRPVVSYVTGRQHAGENLRDVLRERPPELPPPIRMADALNRNTPKDLESLMIIAKCLVHGRRKFVETATSFPDESAHVLGIISEVYRAESLLKRQNASPESRLEYHQTHSGPRMTELKEWLQRQLDEHLIEDNSGFGKAIAYMLKHWDGLTLFLREGTAPLDNNILERALRQIVINRKNSMFYKTMNGAQTADLYTSIIATCRLNGVRSYPYLEAVMKNPEAVAASPQEWMPWSYQKTLLAQEKTAVAA